MKFTEYIKEKIQQQYIHNIQEVKQEVNKKWVQDKINELTFLFPKEELEQSILSNDMIALYFAKSPKKQNFIEKEVMELLQVQKYPEELSYIAEDGLKTKKVKFIYKDFKMVQQYTDECGGYQKNCYLEIYNYLKIGSQYDKVGAVLDGEFWNKNREYLRKSLNSPNIFITSVQEERSDLFGY